MARSLPNRPNLDHLRHEAKAILRAHRNRDRSCCEVLRKLKQLAEAPNEKIIAAEVTLADVQHALAMDYGYPSWPKLKRRVEQTAPPMRESPPARWFHGSPESLHTLRKGSTVTPIAELARAFAHRPSRVGIEVHENDDAGARQVTIEHDGRRDGFLYEVEVGDPATDLLPHTGSTMAPGEEMITTRELPVRLLESAKAERTARQHFDDETAGEHADGRETG